MRQYLPELAQGCGGLALTATRRFLVTEAPGEVFEPVTSGQLDLYEGRVVLARREGDAAVGRLWLRRDADGVVGAGLQPIAGAPLDDGADDLMLIGVAVW
ncbi:hypothetical protein [Micromonospora sp. NPDC005173]|uniref:hypothetical protein n=1 Tax=Micromonospora sp. NPDC005173 TaxID=3157165 RepID=UPI0033A269CB